jgi:hypothetical protein
MAQEPERVRQLVYHVNAFDGQSWEGVFYPQSEDTIYLLAGHRNTITPRETMVYFWTTTQRFRPDWSKLDQRIEASRMEIRRGGNLVEVVTSSDYVLQGTRADQRRSLQLFTGQDARARFAQYQKELDTYWDALEQFRQQRDSGTAGGAPESPDLFSTKVLQGFVVELDAGSYEIRLLDDNNQLIPDSQKHLRVFAPRRSGLSYEIIPESKWTLQEYSDTPQETIYSSGETRLFLQPYWAREYNAFLYGKLQDPQAPPADNRDWTWVRHEPIKQTLLHVQRGVEHYTVERRSYMVEHSARASFGYTIEALETDEDSRSANFLGHEVALKLRPGESASVWLTDLEGEEIEFSRRTLRGIQSIPSKLLFVPALAPITWGLFLALRKLRDDKNFNQ